MKSEQNHADPQFRAAGRKPTAPERMTSPRADAFRRGLRLEGGETIVNPFDNARYWDFYSETD